MQARYFELGDGLEAKPALRSDADALIELVRHNVGHIGRYLPPVADIVTPEKAQAHFDLVERQIEEGSLIDWHLYQDGKLCGEIRFNHIEATNRKTAVGCFIDSRLQGRGLINRAMTRLLAYAFEELRFNRVEWRCDVSNVSSRKVAERLGFVLEGRLRQAQCSESGFEDVLVFSLLASEYVARTRKIAAIP